MELVLAPTLPPPIPEEKQPPQIIAYVCPNGDEARGV